MRVYHSYYLNFFHYDKTRIVVKPNIDQRYVNVNEMHWRFNKLQLLNLDDIIRNDLKRKARIKMNQK